MNCNQVRNALWMGETLEGMDIHLRNCPTCTAEWNAIDNLVSELTAMKVPTPSKSLIPPRDVIRKAVRNRRHVWRSRSITVAAASVAVACLVGGTVVIEKGMNGGSQSPSQSTMAISPQSNDGIAIDTYHGKTFTAKVMFVHNPLQVKVAVTRYAGKIGQTVSEMVRDSGAIGGVNAGAFVDAGSHGPAGIPVGVTMHDGKLVEHTQTSSQYPVVGITAGGRLVCGAYSVAQLQAMKVQEAVSFGPILVQQGRGQVQGDGGWGYNPRTAIGQKADGTIIFITTDGRFVHGADDVGASLKDMQDLMLQYGAITAANLDGGSSTTMVYNGQVVSQPANLSGEREVATSFLIDSK